MSRLMLLAPALLLAGQATAQSPTPRPVDPAVAEQVREIGAKLREWRGVWAAADGKLGCKSVRSTGDEAIDAIGCKATLACVLPIYPELNAIADGPGTEEEKQQKARQRLESINGCLTERRGNGIAALALERGAK